MNREVLCGLSSIFFYQHISARRSGARNSLNCVQYSFVIYSLYSTVMYNLGYFSVPIFIVNRMMSD